MTRSASQWYNQVSIANIIVPKFSVSKDVYDFVSEYEDVTSTLTDEQRSKLLIKAFPPGDHRSWFEVELKPLVDLGRPWSQLKSKIIDRFSIQADRDRHFTRLRELRYDPTGPRMLLDYIDDMLYSYNRAYKEDFSEESCVRYIKSSLPKVIHAKLSAYSDYRDARDVISLKRSAKQYDISQRSEPVLSPDHRATNELTLAIKDLVVSLREELASSKKDNSNIRKENDSMKKEILSALRQNQSNLDRQIRPNSTYESRRSPSPAFRRRSPSPRSGDNRYLSMPKPVNTWESQARNEDKRDGQRQAFSSQSYFELFGMPPSPCSLCNENLWHWSKHCLKHLN